MLPPVFYRPEPRLRILRGYFPGDSRGLSLTRPCTYRALATDILAIKSGQIISTDANGRWVQGATAGVPPYIALQDQFDPDVQGVADKREPGGYLTGISLLNDLLLETAYFDHAGVWPLHAPVYAGTAGNLGSFVATAAGNILGRVALTPDPLTPLTDEQNLVQEYSFVPGSVGVPPSTPEGNDLVVLRSFNSEAALGPNTGTAAAPIRSTRVLRIQIRWS